MKIPAHTLAIDSELWPGVATVPEGLGIRLRARIAEAQFAKACVAADLRLSHDASGTALDLTVEHAELFSRVAASGWVGLAESFLAGEWSTDTPHELPRVLAALLQADYRPKTPHIHGDTDTLSGEIPPELVARYAGDGMSAFTGRFATGVPTTERVSVSSHARGAGRGSEPATHFVDITEISAPLDVERADLGDAQRRAADDLLDVIGAGAGRHVLEYPSAGGACAIAAAARDATVDTVTADPALAHALRERFMFAGVADAVHIELIDDPTYHAGHSHGRYDGIVSIEKLETLPVDKRGGFVLAMDRLLGTGGAVAMQTVVATDAMTPAGRDALESLRAYVWPGLEYPSVEQVHKLVDKHTGLRVVAQAHAPQHLALTLQLQRALFVGQLREAAADGFDSVYRRLWIWQLSLREALAQLGMIDAVQFTMRHRNRRGRR